LPALNVTSVAISGFSSGAYFTNNLCNINPSLFDGCGAFCGGMAVVDSSVNPPKTVNTTEKMKKWRTKY
jgi:predicted esterase